MGFLRDSYIAMALVLSALLLGLSIIISLKATHYETSRWCSMSWSRPQYNKITEFENLKPSELGAVYPKSYGMYHHYQSTHKFIPKNIQRSDRTLPNNAEIDTIIIYIPGQSGSYLQIRSFASRILHQKYLLLPRNKIDMHKDILFLTFNFGEEWSSMSPAIISRQTAFVYTMLTEYLCFDNTLKICDKDKDMNIILIGHSMGGIVTASLVNILSKKPIQSKKITTIDRYNNNILSQIKGVILISTPINKPLFIFENKFKRYYAFHAKKFNHILKEYNINALSLSGGLEDFLIESYLSKLNTTHNIDFIISETCPSIMNTMDHQATVWCHATIETVSRYIVSILLKESKSKMRKYLYPIDFNIKYNSFSENALLTQSFKTKMVLKDIKHSTIVVSCSYPLKKLELCDNNTDKCIDVTKYMRNVPAWISHSKNNKYNFSLNHEHHTFLQKFIGVINGNDISLKNKYLRIRGSAYNINRDKCSLWQGFVDMIDHNNDNKFNGYWNNFENFNKFNNFNLKTNKVYIDELRLSPLMTHDIKITITPLDMEDENLNNDHICVSGWSGMINMAGNGVYFNKTDKLIHYYEQQQSYWYSPYLEMNRFSKESLHHKRLYIYSEPVSYEMHRGEQSKIERFNKWVFGIEVGDVLMFGWCSDETTEELLECKEWNILESDLNFDHTLSGGYRIWRNRVKLSMSNECSPFDVSLLHLRLDSNSNVSLFNQWVSVSSVEGKKTIHRMIVPRVNNKYKYAFDNILQFEYYLFDENKNGQYNVRIEYNYLSSIVNTMTRDFSYFPFVLIMCIWLGLMAEIYNVKGVDLINFYMVTQSVLMIVASFDFLPLNEHWKYVYLEYKLGNVNWMNYKIYLIEFCLPYIYFSSGVVIIYATYLVAELIIKNILFRFVKLIYLNKLFIIPWSLVEYSVYITICLYSTIGIINPDFNYNIKQRYPDVEIHHLIIGSLVIVRFWNLIRHIAFNEINSMFGFYEILLSILLIVTRWDILFGILERQQYFELIIINICLFIISYFKIKDIRKYGNNFQAKALLSFCSQIFIMQKNMRISKLSEQTFILTPILQSFICWTVTKIVIAKYM